MTSYERYVSYITCGIRIELHSHDTNNEASEIRARFINKPLDLTFFMSFHPLCHTLKKTSTLELRAELQSPTTISRLSNHFQRSWSKQLSSISCVVLRMK